MACNNSTELVRRGEEMPEGGGDHGSGVHDGGGDQCGTWEAACRWHEGKEPHAEQPEHEAGHGVAGRAPAPHRRDRPDHAVKHENTRGVEDRVPAAMNGAGGLVSWVPVRRHWCTVVSGFWNAWLWGMSVVGTGGGVWKESGLSRLSFYSDRPCRRANSLRKNWTHHIHRHRFLNKTCNTKTSLSMA